MPISRSKKEELVARYTELLQGSQGMIVTEYRGMTTAQFDTLRAKMREVGSTYMVTKNTLLRLVLADLGMTVPETLLNGPIAVAFAHDDLGATAKAVLDIDKDVELLLVKGALVGSSEYDAKGVDALSKLPTLDELRGQLMGVIIAPLSGFVSLVGTPAQELVGVINGGASQVLNVVAAYVAKQKAEAA
ncbi:MAG: 50S ribosomal protein L10 [Anaerolineae bacterium]|nr:50S ribosomal protein L10 [Anaerolineae bacterium]